MNRYRIVDTFNDRVVSEHRTLRGAVRADDRFIRAVKRANGRNSYIPTTIQHHDHGAWRDIDLADYAV